MRKRNKPAPLAADITYGFNAVDQIRENALALEIEEYESVEDSNI